MVQAAVLAGENKSKICGFYCTGLLCALVAFRK